MKPLEGVTGPPGVVTVTVRKPSVAPGWIVIEMDRLVGPDEVIPAVTPVPLKVTAVAPASPGPTMVAGTVLPGDPYDG